VRDPEQTLADPSQAARVPNNPAAELVPVAP
jgi:hypothetical protein